MLAAIRLHTVVESDGEIRMSGLPFKKGQTIEMIVLAEQAEAASPSYVTARQLSQSEIVGLWKDRTDIQDSAAFARQLREQAQTR